MPKILAKFKQVTPTGTTNTGGVKLKPATFMDTNKKSYVYQIVTVPKILGD